MTGESRQPERAVSRLRPHARALVLPSLVLVLAVGAAPYGAFALDELWQRLAALAAGTVVVGALWLLPLLSWLGTQYLITTRRIVLRRGLFVHTRQEVLLSRGHDVTVRRAGLQSMFRSGDVLINTGLDRPIVLRDVPRADLVGEALTDLLEASTTSIAAARRPADDDGTESRRSRSMR